MLREAVPEPHDHVEIRKPPVLGVVPILTCLDSPFLCPRPVAGCVVEGDPLVAVLDLPDPAAEVVDRPCVRRLALSCDMSDECDEFGVVIQLFIGRAVGVIRIAVPQTLLQTVEEERCRRRPISGNRTLNVIEGPLRDDPSQYYTQN